MVDENSQMMINNTCARSGVIALVMSVTKHESEHTFGLWSLNWRCLLSFW